MNSTFLNVNFGITFSLPQIKQRMECFVNKNVEACKDYCLISNGFEFAEPQLDSNKASLAYSKCMKKIKIAPEYWAEDACDISYNKY